VRCDSCTQPLEAALRCFRDRQPGYQPSGTFGFDADSEAASPDSLGYPQTAEGRFHALELPQTCRSAERQQGRYASGVERGWPEAAPPGGPHGQQRSDFEAKAADIIGLYLNPPQHAAVFCVDEKTAIQALDRLDPAAFARSRRAPWIRILPAWNPLPVCGTGHCQWPRSRKDRCTPHQSGLRRLSEGGRRPVPARSAVHIILDNLSAHKTALAREFLEQTPRVRFHFTPTYSTRSNGGSPKSSVKSSPAAFTSVPDLARKVTTLHQRVLRQCRADSLEILRPFPPRRSNEFFATGH
jgi:hypothetical protein